MLLQSLKDSYFPHAGQFHFIEFMQLIHKKLSEFSGNSDPLLKVVKNLSIDFKIIFIDEFQIEDIADAMIIGTLLEALLKKGTRLFLSSNSDPDNLYKDGLQRAKFIKTINFINENFFIHHLLGAEKKSSKESHRALSEQAKQLNFLLFTENRVLSVISLLKVLCKKSFTLSRLFPSLPELSNSEISLSL